MFYRDYMEYHADRFEDHSLLIHDENDKLIALLPANTKGTTLYSHQGLTFGGFLIDEKMRTEVMLGIFSELIDFLKKSSFKKLVYKCIPHIYHSMPAEEDQYALFLNDARLIRRDVSSTIPLMKDVKYSKGRKWSVNKAKKSNILVEQSNSSDECWSLLRDVLCAQHNATPVHTKEEMNLLITRFPDNIKVYIARLAGEVIAGAVIYENADIAHTQYLANSSTGREIGALDLVIDFLINNIYSTKQYFDFGISNEDSGRILNTGLIAQKEGFGARPIVHDFYELNIK